jgi:hypothetical protein
MERRMAGRVLQLQAPRRFTGLFGLRSRQPIEHSAQRSKMERPAGRFSRFVSTHDGYLPKTKAAVDS